jgi:hypothetical protein
MQLHGLGGQSLEGVATRRQPQGRWRAGTRRLPCRGDVAASANRCLIQSAESAHLTYADAWAHSQEIIRYAVHRRNAR